MLGRKNNLQLHPGLGFSSRPSTYFQKYICQISSKSIRKIGCLAVALGVLAGLGSLFFSTPQATPNLCKNFYSNSPLLRGISQLKQKEIKSFSFLTPMLPVVFKTLFDASRSHGQGFLKGLKGSISNNLPAEQIHSLLKIGALGFTSHLYAPYVGLNTDSFDASGHLMLKTLWGVFLAKSLIHILPKSSTTSKAASVAYGALYALTDLSFLYQTVRACHTPLESLAGLAWGLVIQAL